MLSSSGSEADENIRLEAEKEQKFLSTFLFAFLIIYQHIKTISYRILGIVQESFGGLGCTKDGISF
ncbi:MAG: hypothetical protein ACE5K2_02640 [Candidatus Zixiibacteriota bacterium]